MCWRLSITRQRQRTRTSHTKGNWLHWIQLNECVMALQWKLKLQWMRYVSLHVSRCFALTGETIGKKSLWNYTIPYSNMLAKETKLFFNMRNRFRQLIASLTFEFLCHDFILFLRGKAKWHDRLIALVKVGLDLWLRAYVFFKLFLNGNIYPTVGLTLRASFVQELMNSAISLTCTGNTWFYSFQECRV